MLIVQKFGGTSLADPERLRRAAGICRAAREQGHRLILVVSAPGDTTDRLSEDAQALQAEPDLREMDALLATGEQQSAARMAMALEELGVPARSLTGWQAGLITDSRHGDADIRLLLPDRLRETLREDRVAVVAGFQGVDRRGDITTLGRGGSDTTAVALAAALGAERCEIYTDVDGIYTADPRLVPEARLLKEIDSRDMLALARGGSQVLHPRSVALALSGGLTLQLLSSFRPGPGTAVRLLEESRRPAFAGVTRDPGSHTVTAVGRAADGACLAELVTLLTQNGVPVLSAEAEEGAVHLRVEPAQLPLALELAHQALF